MISRSGRANGCNKMPVILAAAPTDIRYRLWTLYWLARLTRKTGVIVELGVRDGDTTRTLLAACEDSGSRLFSWDVNNCEPAVRDKTARMGLPWFAAEWRFSPGDSVNAGHAWERGRGGKGPVDMVFVDTDHTLATTRAEIAAWSPHVRLGGCMAFHDYWLASPPQDGVEQAVDEFAGEHGDAWLLETHDAGADGDTGFAILWKRQSL